MARRDKGDFMSRAGKITKEGYRKTAAVTSKGAGKIARHYKKYVRPTTKILRGAGRTVSFLGKTALRFPGTGLALTAGYLGAKGIAKRQKGLTFPQYRQFSKRGRKII